ncbi:hypothetical protein DY000_02007202 [Brassica cretica]|uniref:Uncharacterized protein n=1 Tax=Brassica cretica TaxID=69181 RepID=A0ABQ7CEC0_BRACR|nr:hypothetical protein DY000_02007202 [Brassica cretica]
MIDPRIWLEPEGFRDWTLRSFKSTGCSFRSGYHIRTLAYLDPEVSWEPEGTRRFFRDVMTPMRLRLHRGSSFFFIFGTLRPDRNPKGPYSASLGKATTGTCLDFAFAARKLATIDFICCILLLLEVTDRLRGCWCGCYYPSARLHCFPCLEKQGLDCSMYFTVFLQ